MVSKPPMQKLNIKKGYRFRMTGSPGPTVTCPGDPTHVAVLPERIPHIKPRLHVKEGDPVKIGSLLFEDKRNANFKFLSPGGGMVEKIQYGPRRVVQSIVIRRQNHDEPRARFTSVSQETLDQMGAGQIKDLILEGGLWWVFRELPFRDMPDPRTEPPLILVGLANKEPFSPSPAVYLKDRGDLFDYGLKVLSKISNRVVVYSDAGLAHTLGPQRSALTHAVTGHYPSDDPGTVLYHIKRSTAENRAWFITGQDLLLLAQLLSRGKYPTERTVSVGGSGAPARQHFNVRLGAPLSQVIKKEALADDHRIIVGGMLRGYAGAIDGFIGLYETSVNVIPEGGQAEFLALFKPGFGKPSYSRIFASKLNPKPLTYDCRINGDQRACIACMHCADVCPVEMWPQMVYKAIQAGEVEEYLELGLLDCVECGLCSYVCPSKIELRQTFVETRAAYWNEQRRKE